MIREQPLKRLSGHKPERLPLPVEAPSVGAFRLIQGALYPVRLAKDVRVLSSIHLSDLPETVSFAEAAIVVGSWFGMGLVEPLRAGLAVASVWPLAILLTARSPVALLALTLSITIAGIWAADAWEARLAIKDDRRVVVDEVAGYLAGMAAIGRVGWLGASALAGIFLVLDRLKPFPFDRIEGIPGGIGVMLDDVAMGVALGLAAVLLVAAWRRMSGSGVSP